MRHWFHALMAVFFILLTLFYGSEFAIFSSIPGSSSFKLLSQREAFPGPKKVILVVIDSLRYDYIQRLPFVQAALESKPSKSFLVKCKVGNPTMTTQRIESLMTGSEIFSSTTILKSFFASRTSTDNIVDQLNLQNKTSFVMGDDTWMKLFSFTGGEICSNTYNVHDYDSCDQSIYYNMIEEITSKPGYSLTVSHFLALDHIGHSTSNIYNQLMDAKMNKISGFIERIIWEMQNDTLLLVTGDHGMRIDGNHGGSTESQTQTFLFGYNRLVDFSGLGRGKIISQPDITATLSLYLDTPIPMNSVGVPIIQAMPSELINNYSAIKQVYSNLLSHFNMMSRYYTPHSQKIELYFPQNLNNEQQLEVIEGTLLECTSRLQFLKYSTPNQSVNKIILASLSFVSMLIVILVLRINLNNLRHQSNNLASIIRLLTKLAVGFMLFVAYFSWYLIQNLSNLYLIFLMAFVIVICFGNKDAGIPNLDQQIVAIIMLIFLICQIQPAKSSQYSTNAMKLRIFQTLLDSIAIKGILVSVLIYQYWRKVLDLRRDKYARYMIMPLLALAQINYILTFCVHTEPYILRALILILTIGLTINFGLKGIRDPQAITITFSLFILLFLGENGPIIIYFCSSITQKLIKLQVSPLFFCFLSQFLWWLMGNRFEYSGIDVVKSYIFSAEYHPILNGPCILIIVMSPHLTLFIQMSILVAAQKAGQKEYTSVVSNQQAQNLDNQQKNEDKSQFLSILMQQFMLVPLLGLLSSAWNVDYNNSKILFTVVYLPMLLFSLIKAISVYAMIAVAHLLTRK